MKRKRRRKGYVVSYSNRARVYEDHKLSRCTTIERERERRERGGVYICLRRFPSPFPAQHPKYLHWPVAKLKSNRFEMTFHLTKHKSGGPYAPTTFAPTRRLVRPARTMSFLSLSVSTFLLLSLSLPLFLSPASRGSTWDDFHGPSRRRREISLCEPPFVSPANRSDGNCYCALISRMSQTWRVGSAG